VSTAALAPSSSRRVLSAFLASFRLGWAVTSNWTSVRLFALYSVLRPVSGVLVLVFMYRAITGNSAASEYLAFLVVGTGFWSFVQESMGGFADSISEDRGRYRMLKYLYIAAPRFGVYLVGRCAAHLVTSIASVAVVMLLATPLLHLPVTISTINVPLLALAMVLATVVVMVIAIAYGVLLLAMHDSYGYGELLAQMLYIISGAIFPLTVLPGAVRALAEVLPLSYWLELVRRALLGDHTIKLYPALSDAAVVGRLALTTVGLAVLGQVIFVVADRRARRLGLIDMETQF
jgi:ABC-2 type transport system permease protein